MSEAGFLRGGKEARLVATHGQIRIEAQKESLPSHLWEAVEIAFLEHEERQAQCASSACVASGETLYISQTTALQR